MPMKDNKENLVAVTGIGMICPLGITTDECWGNMLEGKSGIRKITRFDAGECLTRIAGEIPDKYFQMEKAALSPGVYKRCLLPSRLSIVSAEQAVKDAGIDLEYIDKSRVGVISGCGGSIPGDLIVNMDQGGKKRHFFPHEMLNALPAGVSVEFGFKGPSFNVAVSCASGAFAVGLAYDYVRRTGDLCIAIGIDTMVHKDTIDGFNRLMALSEKNEWPEKASRPFDRKRSGFVISEGACAVLLESYEHAIRRGARIYAAISGAAFTSEAFNIIAPEPEGRCMAETMASAIKNAGISKEKIGYISAHGTSTLHNDLAETKAIKRIFGSDAYSIPVSSQKSMTGHCIGASGAIEFAVTALSLHNQVITPTINYEAPDPECDLDYVPNMARKVHSLETAMTNSFGFGGHNSTIILERHHAIP